MKYAVVENGIVTNVIWLYPGNADEFPNAIPLNDIPAGIGDTYDEQHFYRNGERIYTPLETAQNTIAELDIALIESEYQSIIGGLE